MVSKAIGASLLVAVGAGATFLIGKKLLEKDQIQPLPPDEQPFPGEAPAAGTLGSISIEVQDVEQFAPDLFIIQTRYINLSNEEQTFDAIMQITDPNNQVQTIKDTRVTIPGLSSRSVRFSTGNLFKLAIVSGIWRAIFFAWKSIETDITLAEDVAAEFQLDVL